MTILSNGKRWPRDFHFWVSVLLAIAVVPFLRELNLTVRFDWLHLGSAYWLVLAAQSIFVATLLYLIGVARVQPLLERIRRDKLRIVLGLAFFLILFWAFTWLKAIILTVDAIAVLEFRERLAPAVRRQAALSILDPSNLPFCRIPAHLCLQRHHSIGTFLRGHRRGIRRGGQMAASWNVRARPVSLGDTIFARFLLPFFGVHLLRNVPSNRRCSDPEYTLLREKTGIGVRWHYLDCILHSVVSVLYVAEPGAILPVSNPLFAISLDAA